jgi:RNA recognition motif-containing protein
MNIYIGNLPYGTSEDELKELFQTHGEVGSVRIITDRETGRSKGFAFVEMPNNDEAQKVLDTLNNTEFNGRNLRVNEARPREQRSNNFRNRY